MKIKVHTDLYIRVPMAAFDDPSLSRADFRVLTAICRQMNNETNVATNITYDYLVKTSGSGKTTVCNSIKTLIERGYIIKSNKNGYKTANQYKVNFDVTYEVDDTSTTGQYINTTLAADVESGKEGATDALEVVCTDSGEVTMHEVKGQKRHWTVSKANGTQEDHSEKRTSKKLTRTLKKVSKKVEKTTTPAAKTTPSKPVFSRGYDKTTHTTIPSKNDPLTAWSGYDGTALAERDKTRGPLKGGKRVYSVLGQKFTMVMMEDGETVNMFASEVKTFSPTVMRYFKIPHYTEEQWADIKKGAKRA